MRDMIKPEKQECCSNLEDLKKEYEKFKKKYDLPKFFELNKLFDVEELDVETDFLLRKIRRIISDRIAGYLRFIETILNPSNAPMFFFKLIKKLESKDKEVLSEIYEVLGSFEIELIKLDLYYEEEKEAKFIKDSFKLFNEEIREKLLKITNKLGDGDDTKKENNNSYCG